MSYLKPFLIVIKSSCLYVIYYGQTDVTTFIIFILCMLTLSQKYSLTLAKLLFICHSDTRKGSKNTVHADEKTLSARREQSGSEGIKNFMFNSAEDEILKAHNYKNIKKFSIFQAQISLE